MGFAFKPFDDLAGFDSRFNLFVFEEAFLLGKSSKIVRTFSRLCLDVVDVGLECHGFVSLARGFLCADVVSTGALR